MEQGEKVITVLRKSRKSFLVEYGCALLLIGLLAATYWKGITLPPSAQYYVLGIAVVAVASAELSRFLLRYTITTSKISIIKGVIQQNKKNVHFLPLGYVPDINLKQNRIQRLLNYGTVFVHSTGENSFELKDIDHPQRVLEMVENLVDEARRRQVALPQGTTTRK